MRFHGLPREVKLKTFKFLTVKNLLSVCVCQTCRNLCLQYLEPDVRRHLQESEFKCHLDCKTWIIRSYWKGECADRFSALLYPCG